MTKINLNRCLSYEKRWDTSDALQNADASLPPIRFDCGTEDFLLQANRTLHQALNDANIPHEYAEFPGAHEWSYWSQHVEDSLLFFNRILNKKGLPV